MSTRDDQREPFAAAPDRHHASRLDDFVQPALAQFATRLRRAFKQTRSRGRQIVPAPSTVSSGKLIDACASALANSVSVFFDLLFQLMNARQQIAISKTSLGDRCAPARSFRTRQANSAATCKSHETDFRDRRVARRAIRRCCCGF